MFVTDICIVMWNVRKAEPADLDRLMEIYEGAKRFMARTGNPNQWIDGYPSREVIAADISKGHCHVWEEDGEIIAAFALIVGNDPTYSRIDDGQWLNDLPYAVVHRLASSGKRGGIGRDCLQWCVERHRNLRVDTHADNRVMQRTLENMGFRRCGIIYCHNGTPRIAYQLTL